MKRIVLTLAAALVGFGLLAPKASADPPSWGFRIGIGSGGVSIGARVGHGEVRHVAPAHPVHPVHPGKLVRQIRHGRLFPHKLHRKVVLAPPVHVHHQVPIYQQVWVPPVQSEVFVGYNIFGHPIYKTVVVRAGYYNTVIIGYRCDGCGCRL